MDAEEILFVTKRELGISYDDLTTTPTMYDPNKMQAKVSFLLMDKNGGLEKRFRITVEDVLTDENGYKINK